MNNNEVVLDTLEIQQASLDQFMSSLGYKMLPSHNKLIFFSNLDENKSQAVISFGNAVRLHNSMYSLGEQVCVEGVVYIFGFKFPSYLYFRARSSQLVSEVGLHYTKTAEGFITDTSKDFVYFVNDSEFMMGNKVFLKEFDDV